MPITATRTTWQARILILVLAALAAVSAPYPAFAQAVPSLADLAFYDGPDRTQKLIDGAKKEGAVSIYSSMTVDDTKIVTSGFEKKYGIKVSAWRGSSEDILRRAVVEARGGRYDVDVIETSAAEMESLHRERLLQEVKTPLLSDIVPSAIRPHREWVGDRLNIISAGYNTDLIKPAALPKSYADLLDPKWKGKLAIEADDSVWFGALVSEMGEAKGLQYFRDLVRTNGLSLRKGHTLIANLIISGEVPYSLTVYDYKVKQLKHSGAPIDYLVLPPGIARFLGTGVLKRAPHRYASLLFFDYMMHDAQALLANYDFTPTNMKVRPLDLSYKLIDPALVLDEGEKWQKLFAEIVQKGGR